MNAIEKLTELFSRFPGVGQRQAKRFANFLLLQDQSFIKDLTDNISTLKKSTVICQSCFRFFFSRNIQSGTICGICKNPERKEIIMVVSRDIDLENIEKSSSFNGKYFILGGTVPILEKSPEKRVRIKNLLEKIENLTKKNGLSEIILAMDFNPEGENTADFVKKELSPLQQKHGFKISILGKGLSMGTELEYSDAETIKNALKNRNTIQ